MNVGSKHYDVCEESLCSLRSLVSADFNYDGDDHVDESKPLNADGGIDKERSFRLHGTSLSSTTSYCPCVSQRSINTEMTIIASTSPEIKALNLLSPPTFPDEIKFESSHRRLDSLDSLFSADSTCESSIVERPFVSPMMASMDHEDGRSDHSEIKRVSILEIDADAAESAFMEEADALCFFMKRQSLGGLGTEDRINHKENVYSNLNTSRSSIESRATISPGHVPQFTSPFHERPSMHRRVSFTSLPSPAEIVSPVVASPPTRYPASPRAARTCYGIGRPSETKYFPSSTMDLTL
jgi:hypothetical protein